MGNTLEQYRAAIGSYYFSNGCVFKQVVFHGSVFEYLYVLPMLTFKAFAYCLSYINSFSLYLNFYYQFFTYILLLCGDIEMNPGPCITNVFGIIHLNIRSIRNKIEFLNTFIQGPVLNFYLQFFMFLLLLCGDIEVNPGPIMANVLDILHLNIRSIRNKVAHLNTIVHDFDILCFTETHLDCNVTNESIMLDGFKIIYRKDRNCFGGGVMIYLSDLLRAIRRPEFETTHNESIWIEIESHTCSYFLCCVYRPPNSDGNFWTSLSWSIEKVGEITDNIIIIGDLNVDLLSIPQTHVIHDIMSNGNLVNNINEPTRVTNTSSTLIDLVLSTPIVKVHESGVLNVDSSVSDHKAIYISLSIDIELNRAYERNIWVYKDADFEKLNSLIYNCDWDSIINSAPNIDAAVAHSVYFNIYVICS